VAPVENGIDGENTILKSNNMNVTKPLYLFALLLLFGCGGQLRNEDNAESCDSAQLETPHTPGTQPEATISQANEEEIARGAA
jgi:hypothetical protein